ncbi:NAD-binding protein [Kitasatospora sp. GP82]|uniref:NAD-binding protein n=1 Tax=Kitasatospora sp. GP82 TaxID=3035089 RepID=UPI0024732287|nr:NAD-binding protein [Kitasatospora sp. GP82]MDH6125642.1 voltage-gated potassium channel Kch [Kitasatospora sp. GP82]
MIQEGQGDPPDEQFANHYVVCGGNALAHRLIRELIEQYDVPVVVLVPDLARDHGPQILQLPGVTAVLEYATVTEEALRAVRADSARGIALVDGSDQENIHAALSAQGHNPGIRVVVRMFNQRLGEHIERLLDNCSALSGSATAAPAFANGALGRPNSVQVGDRYLYVAYNEDIHANQICVVADRIDRRDLSRLRLLPDTAGRAAEFIALASRFGAEGPVEVESRPGGTGEREPAGVAALQTLTSEPPLAIPWWTRMRWGVLDALRFFTSARLRLVLITALVAVLLGAMVIWYFNGSLAWASYFTLLDMAGAAQPDQPGVVVPGALWQRVAQVVITFCGITFVPVLTAIVVDALSTGRRGLPRAPGAGTRDHVIVVGLGNVGTRVAALVREAGVPVVCVERDPQARGIAAVRALGIPVVVGDGPLESQLRRARVQYSRAVVAVTNDDATNLEAALESRAVRREVRIGVRLFNDDFAHHVYATLGNVASRSVSYLAAPAFAASLMGRDVLGTLSVYRHVLLIAELTAGDDTGLVGRNLHDIEEPGGIRVIAVRLARRPEDYQWNYADRARRLVPGDRIVVAATRSGLARINAPVPVEG